MGGLWKKDLRGSKGENVEKSLRASPEKKGTQKNRMRKKKVNQGGRDWPGGLSEGTINIQGIQNLNGLKKKKKKNPQKEKKKRKSEEALNIWDWGGKEFRGGSKGGGGPRKKTKKNQKYG